MEQDPKVVKGSDTMTMTMTHPADMAKPSS